MFDPIRRVSAADIASATVLAVVSIDAPSELNSRAGSTNGAMCLVTQNVAGINEWTLYAFDASSSGSVNSPYVLAASGSGQWIAFAGKYVNSAHLIAGAVTLAKSSGTALTIASTNAASATTAGGYTSTVATGTAPFTATSTTVCPNLNAANLNGTTWTAPGAIGGVTPGTAAFTTISATGAITSTLATGTAPFTVASTTVVANLNVSQLLGSTWAVPGTIGSTTRNTALFTTLGANGAATFSSTMDVTGAATYASTISQSGTYIDATSIPNLLDYKHRTTTTASNASRGYLVTFRRSCYTGQTDNGDSTGLYFQILRNADSGSVSDNGTVNRMQGVYLQVGSSNTIGAATPVTNNIESFVIDPTISTGSVGTFYGLWLKARSGAGTITTMYGVKQDDASALNVFAGATSVLSLSVGSTTMLTSSVAFTNGAAAQVATMTNGPTAGNPTKWIPINDNGTTRYIPAW